jgi:peptide/nickel transport system permease protein
MPSSIRASGYEMILRRALRHSGFVAGASVLLIVVVMAAFAPAIAPYGPITADSLHTLANPAWTAGGTWQHVLGTDALGRDELSRLIYGARTTLTIAVTASLIAAVIGTALGTVGGYFGGWIDAFVVYVINVKLALPIILVALAVISITRGSIGVLILVLGLLTWDRYALVTRTRTQQLREREFIQAAHSMGASNAFIIFRELLPNLLDQVIVLFTLEIAALVLIEAALSFVGLGVPPPTASWGSMIADGRSLMFFKPHLVMIPGIAIFIVVLAINLAGDGIRDITAPQ